MLAAADPPELVRRDPDAPGAAAGGRDRGRDSQLTLTGQENGVLFTLTLEPAPARDTRLRDDHWQLFVTPAANE
ncbi:hypothetical protein [Deinococcus aquaticus]|uniref:hypothetical protein n=1 Tax=Deinococcus aquaticus TaxID=328692 RepID=UPI003F47767F